jgi:hypothetical protein
VARSERRRAPAQGPAARSGAVCVSLGAGLAVLERVGTRVRRCCSTAARRGRQRKARP